MASKMEGIMLLKTKFLLAEAWTLALRKTYLQCSLFLAALKKTNLPSPLAPLSITFILGQRYFSSTYVQIFSHWALVLPRVTYEGKRHEPEARLCTGIYSQTFAPGAAHLSLPISLLLILKVRTVPGWLNISAIKASRDGTFSHRWIWAHMFSYTSSSPFVQGLLLLTSEPPFPLSYVTSNRNRNPKAKG